MKWLFGLAVIIGLIILFITGPTVPVSVEIRPIILSEGVEAYVQKSEAKFSDIRPGTEKTIIWANPLKKDKTPISIISIHGFCASRQETVPVADMVASQLGANLFYTRLTGHGRTGDALASATVNDWLQDAVEALEIGSQLGEKVIVMGSSMGGTLAMWLATYTSSENILAYVLHAPSFAPKDSNAKILLWPWAAYFVPVIVGENWKFIPQNPQQKQYWTTEYPTQSLFPMMGLTKLVSKSDFGQLKQPFFFIFSMEDQVVDSAKTIEVYNQLASHLKDKLVIEHSRNPEKHILAGDILSPENNKLVTEAILTFLVKIPDVSLKKGL